MPKGSDLVDTCTLVFSQGGFALERALRPRWTARLSLTISLSIRDCFRVASNELWGGRARRLS
jgi:hypothetical protein